MSSYRDKTFCASPNCQNECGRKMTADEERRLDALVCKAIAEDGENAIVPVSYAYFCDIPQEYIESIKSNEAPE